MKTMVGTLAAVGISLAAAGTAHADSVYQQGYDDTHAYYSVPGHLTDLEDGWRQHGYGAFTVCLADEVVSTGHANSSTTPDDWERGCMDALHSLGFKH